MLQAIEVKYAGPTNTRGARLIASAGPGKMTISWDHSLDQEDNFWKAAMAYREKHGWRGRLLGGATKDGFVFVFDEPQSREPITRRRR